MNELVETKSLPLLGDFRRKEKEAKKGENATRKREEGE
jgi:hypothetical protein